MKRARVVLTVVFAVVLAGCPKLFTAPSCEEFGGCGPSKTCSGQDRTDTAQQYVYIFELASVGCLVENVAGAGVTTWTGLANDADEAKGCALGALGLSESLASVHDLSELETRYFDIVDWNTCPGRTQDYCSVRPRCDQAARPAVSASGAMSCVSSQWAGAGVEITDVTNQVRLPDGGASYPAWNASCPARCCVSP